MSLRKDEPKKKTKKKGGIDRKELWLKGDSLIDKKAEIEEKGNWWKEIENVLSPENVILI